MGTRSLTVIHDYDDDEIVVLYRQFDGYPEGHGAELASFLKGMIMVNGLRMGDTQRVANGPGCLAALIVAHFKGDTPGGFYLYKAGTRDVGEEYIYHVRPRESGEIDVDVTYGDGSPVETSEEESA